ncbi:MAG: DUF1934 domain-containing protein [Clostridia bacterium]|nr:DUF1934 domain-containing protein [Clostridia bacterium]
MKAKIKITTSQTEYRGKSIFERACEELLIKETFDTFQGDDTVETTLYGEISTRGSTFFIKYEEESEGMGGVFTEVSFDLAKPKEISISRSGALESCMYFEEGKRHICVYDTGIMPFEICIFSRTVDNQLATSGILNLVYLIEIKGACAQKTVFKMEVEKI